MKITFENGVDCPNAEGTPEEIADFVKYLLKSGVGEQWDDDGKEIAMHLSISTLKACNTKLEITGKPIIKISEADKLSGTIEMHRDPPATETPAEAPRPIFLRSDVEAASDATIKDVVVKDDDKALKPSKRRRNQWAPEQDSQLLDLADEKLSIATVSKKIGRSKSAVNNRLFQLRKKRPAPDYKDCPPELMVQSARIEGNVLQPGNNLKAF